MGHLLKDDFPSKLVSDLMIGSFGESAEYFFLKLRFTSMVVVFSNVTRSFSYGTVICSGKWQLS